MLGRIKKKLRGRAGEGGRVGLGDTSPKSSGSLINTGQLDVVLAGAGTNAFTSAALGTELRARDAIP